VADLLEETLEEEAEAEETLGDLAEAKIDAVALGEEADDKSDGDDEKDGEEEDDNDDDDDD